MSLVAHPWPLAAAITPYVQTKPAALAFWLLINLASLAFEANQWQRRRDEAARADGGSFRILMVGTVAGLALLVLAPQIAPAAAIQPVPAGFAAGATLFVAGFATRRWSEMTLGRYFTFSVMVSDDQPVITTGPYRFVRHPGYSGVVLIVVGSGLVAGNWFGLGAWTLLVCLPLLYRIHVEEAALLTALGDDYRRYALRHKRLIPLIW